MEPLEALDETGNVAMMMVTDRESSAIRPLSHALLDYQPVE